MKRDIYLIIALITTFLMQMGALGLTLHHVHAQEVGIPDLSSGLPEGVAIRLLYSSVNDDSARAGAGSMLTTLVRIPLQPGEILEGRSILPGIHPRAEGRHLLFVEAGAPTFISGERTDTVQTGNSLVMEPVEDYKIHNNTSECVSVLRFTELTGQFGAGTRASEDTPFIPQNCGKLTSLMANSAPYARQSVVMFVAEISWQPGSSVEFPDGHPGPIVLLVRSGTLSIRIAGTDRSSQIIEGAGVSMMQPGAVVGFSDHQAYRSTNPTEGITTALMFGVIETSDDLWGQYISEGERFTLTLDRSEWWITGEGHTSSYDFLDLSSVSSNVKITAGDFNVSPSVCTATLSREFATNPNISDMRLDEDWLPQLTDQAGLSQASTHYTYVHHQAGGNQQLRSVVLECRVLQTTGETIAMTADFPQQNEAVVTETLQLLFGSLTLVDS